VGAGSSVRFGEFEIDPAARELRRNDELIRLQDLPFRLLVALTDRPGELLTRTELRERLWGSETFVDYEAGLNTAIAKLREALGDNADQPVFIETLPKRGYRFVGKIEAALQAPAIPPGPVAASGHTASPVAVAAPRPTRWRAPIRLAAIGLLAAVGVSLYWAHAVSPVTRIAVVLFDNETGRPEFDRLAQQLTDATVLKLTARPALAVIGNAAVLRTTRPFRDIIAIRDALQVSYLVIGQVQEVDGAIRAQAHLIRAGDQSHLWVGRVPLAPSGEAAAQEDMAARIDRAVAQKVLSER
jgi:DNA-binding winged helix-turn-helix (wHTH) protein/TolB-like protein